MADDDDDDRDLPDVARAVELLRAAETDSAAEEDTETFLNLLGGLQDLLPSDAKFPECQARNQRHAADCGAAALLARLIGGGGGGRSDDVRAAAALTTIGQAGLPVVAGSRSSLQTVAG
eukprot:SAG22_NODE_3339_length_1770_cov_0.929982_2_plen_119_part_00